MNSAQLPRDILTAATEKVVRAQEELSAAGEQARRDANSIDWLADRPDLLRLDGLIKEIPSRQAELDRAQREYDHTYGELLSAADFAVPPQLIKDLSYYRWLDSL